MNSQPLLTPVRMGKLELRNRIIMAPLTRMRASNAGHVPTDLHAEYYAQRASAGLIIGECTEISLTLTVGPILPVSGASNRFKAGGA
jgi:N-ethylmaleimide reductase